MSLILIHYLYSTFYIRINIIAILYVDIFNNIPLDISDS